MRFEQLRDMPAANAKHTEEPPGTRSQAESIRMAQLQSPRAARNERGSRNKKRTFQLNIKRGGVHNAKAKARTPACTSRSRNENQRLCRSRGLYCSPISIDMPYQNAIDSR